MGVREGRIMWVEERGECGERWRYQMGERESGLERDKKNYGRE